MKQKDNMVELSSLESALFNLQAQGAAVALYSAKNEASLTQEDLSKDEVIAELNENYRVAFEYLTGIYMQQPKKQEMFKGLEKKISRSGTHLKDLLNGGEEENIFLNKMYSDSIVDVFGEGESGAINYLDSHLGAQATIDSAIRDNSGKISEDDYKAFELLSNMYTISTIAQTQEIFGALPSQYQHLLENPANDNSAANGYNLGDRDAA